MKQTLKQIKNCDALRIGLLGGLITLTLNIIAYIALKHPAALPYHDQWWSSWFPLYTLWSVFLLGGGLHYIFSRNEQEG